MANEKPFSNKIRGNNDAVEPNEKQIHNINETEELDFVDFSSAFDGEDEDDKAFEPQEEELFDSRPVSSLIKGLSFRKKDKDNKEADFVKEPDDDKTEDKLEKHNNKKSKHKKEKAEKVEDPHEQEMDDAPVIEETLIVEKNPTVEKIQEEQNAEDVVEEKQPVIIEEESEFEEDSAEEEFEELAPFEYNEDDEYDDDYDDYEDDEDDDDDMPALVIDRVKQKKNKADAEKTSKQTKKDAVGQLTFKDHLTFILIIIALLLTIVFICVKFIPFGNNNSQDINTVTDVMEKVSEIQIQRDSAVGHYIQSDIENVFYVYTADYDLTYYQCDNDKMNELKASGVVNATAEVGTEKLPVKIDYIDVNGQLFGTGIFRASESQGNYYHNMVIFKLVNLPKDYEQDGKALLLATTNEDAVSQKCTVWNDSFIVDLSTGKTERFLTADDGVYSTGYSILTDEGYASVNGRIPFFTTREYDATTNKRDIYIKEQKKETIFATDVAGSFLYTSGDAVSYLKVTDTGFNAVKKENDKEIVLFSLKTDTSYIYYNEYLLDKYSGTLYNVKTGKETAVEDYGMSNAEMIAVSDNGRYLVVLGTVNSALDYQVHIFDLKSGKCQKYEDENFSQHKNLAFADDATVVYSVVEPSKGYEYVMLDASKAF